MIELTPHRERLPEIDRLKAAAILGVVWLHCFNEFGAPRSGFAVVSKQITDAAVPAFFFASGLLNFTASRFPPGTLGRWARRLLPPYLLASLGAFAFKFAHGQSISASSALFDLALGNAIGIYYFVFALWQCLLLSLALARFRWLAPALFPFFAFGPLLQALYLDPVQKLLGFSILVEWRSPLAWLGYYLAGWLGARWRDDIPWRRVGIAACVVWLAVSPYTILFETPGILPKPGRTAATTVQIFAAILAIVGLARRPRVSKLVLWLSSSTYALYLWHLYVVVSLEPLFGSSEGDRLAIFLLALGTTAAAIAALRAIAPRASRLLLGA